MSNNVFTRRRFIAGFSGTIICTLGRQTIGGELQPLSPEDPIAVALGYVADAKNLDVSEQPSYKPGSNCANCSQFKDVDADGFGTCALFPAKKLHAKAWCKAWIKM